MTDEQQKELKSITIQTIKEFLMRDFSAILGEILKVELKKAKAPPLIQGDRKAGELLGISAEAMKMRRRNGFYREGIDFKKNRGIIIWNTDALLNSQRIHNAGS